MEITTPLYLKLSSQASNYSDPIIGIKIANKEVILVDASARQLSKKLDKAIRNGHVNEASESEFKAWKSTLQKDSTTSVKLDAERRSRNKGKLPKDNPLLTDDELDSEETDEDEDEESPTGLTEVELADMSKSELIEHMKAMGTFTDEQMTGFRKAKAEDLVKAIKDAQGITE